MDRAARYSIGVNVLGFQLFETARRLATVARHRGFASGFVAVQSLFDLGFSLGHLSQSIRLVLHCPAPEFVMSDEQILRNPLSDYFPSDLRAAIRISKSSSA